MEARTGIKVLYLSEWYPNRYDNSSGRFVRGHAMSAVKQGADVCVLYLCKAQAQDDASLFEQETEGIKEVYVYYHNSYIMALHRGWTFVRKHWGIPDLCQLNIISKNALLPLWLRLTQRIPYIIVEHWTGYYPEVNAFKGILHRLLAQLVAHHAKIILTVSTELATHMQRCGLNNKDYRLIRNVVYDFFFHPIQRKNDGIKRMLHVSYFDDAHKNVSDIVRAIAILSKRRQDFECVMVGNGEDHAKVRQLALDLTIPEALIDWTGELNPEQVCELFYQSDFFVFYSNYETAGIVLTESLICGKPVISTAVGIAPDIITPKTGRLVPKQTPAQLAETMDWMLDHYTDFDTAALRAIGKQYSITEIGKELNRLYTEVISYSS